MKIEIDLKMDNNTNETIRNILDIAFNVGASINIEFEFENQEVNSKHMSNPLLKDLKIKIG